MAKTIIKNTMEDPIEMTCGSISVSKRSRVLFSGLTVNPYARSRDLISVLSGRLRKIMAETVINML